MDVRDEAAFVPGDEGGAADGVEREHHADCPDRTPHAAHGGVGGGALLFCTAQDAKGERITIARAGKPVAQLGPAPKATRRKPSLDDPLLRLDEWGFEGPVGKLTNTEIDRIVYGI